VSAAIAAVALAAWPAAVSHADPTSPLYALVDTAAQRLGTGEQVAANKWNTGAPITDAPRVEQVLTAVGTDAEARGIDAQQVRRIFTDQIAATEGLEYTRFAQWKFDPAAAPTKAPDLAQSRTIIDGYNRTMVAELAAHWPLLRSAECAGELGVAKTAVAGTRALDPLYRQALDVATRSYCGR
jgi:chorismate mutase